jgi:hypothetical protein
MKNYLLRISIIIVALLAFSGVAQTPQNKAKLASTLAEAEDYLLVKPSKSLALLSIEADLTPLSAPQLFRWHIAKYRSGLALSKLDVMEQSIIALISQSSSKEFERRIVSILSSIGIWMRMSGYLEQANLVFMCAIKYNMAPEKEVRLLNSFAITSRHLNQNDDAIKAYKLAKNIAIKEKVTTALPVIENNLGVLAMENEKMTDAEEYLRLALAMYQSSSNRSGNITSGINLLQLFLILDQPLNYQRLYSSIARLTETFPNETRKGALFWLNTVFQSRQGIVPNEAIRAQLKASFYKINDRKLQLSLQKYFANELNVNTKVANQISQQRQTPLWFDNINQCHWQQLKTINLEDLK